MSCNHDRQPDKGLRIDKLLWFLRFARNRVMAKKLSEKGHIRLNGRRIDRAHVKVHAGDILTIPVAKEVKVVRVINLPKRRGGAPVAQSHYEILKPGY